MVPRDEPYSHRAVSSLPQFIYRNRDEERLRLRGIELRAASNAARTRWLQSQAAGRQLAWSAVVGMGSGLLVAGAVFVIGALG